jgi:hypothetical protein
VGDILDAGTGLKPVRTKVHNAVFIGDKIEAITPEKNITLKIKKILNDKKEEIKEAHGGHEKMYYFEFDKVLPEGSLIRKKISRS